MTSDSASPPKLAAGASAMLGAVPFPLCVISPGDGSVLLVNAAFTELTGYRAEDIPSQEALGNLLDPAAESARGDTACEQWIARGTQTGAALKPLTFRLRCRNGRRQLTRGHLSRSGDLCIFGIENLSEQEQLRTELHQSGLRYRSLLEQSMVGIFALQDDTLTYVNPRFAELFGYELDEIIDHRSLPGLAAAEDTSAVARQLQWLRESPEEDASFVFAAIRKDGAVIDVEAVARLVDFGEDSLILGALSDVTDRVRAERQLEYLAFHDSLTGLPNRALLYDRLSQAIKQARRYGRGFGLMMVDLDGFKGVNDTQGHEAGDAVLRIIGQRLLGCVRQSDTVARMGGDEFALVLQETGTIAALSSLAERLVKAVSEPIDLSGKHFTVGASIGIAMYDEPGTTMDLLMSRADTAMYAQKRNKAAGFTFFQDGVHRDGARETRLVRWSADKELGVAIIDQQHRRLVEMVNGLAAALAAAEDGARLRALLADLADFTAHHFATEESLMDRYQIASARGHKEQHRKLLDELKVIERQLGSAELSRTLSGISAWLLHHIEGPDNRLGRELRAQGVR